MSEDRVDKIIMMSLGSFARKVSSTWINPAKSRPYYEDERRVFFKDESSEGLYPACIVTENLLEQIVVIIPINKFAELLSAWKQIHESEVSAVKTIVKKEMLGEKE